MDEQRRRRTAEARGRKTPQAVGGEHRHCGVWVGRGPPQRKKRVGGVKRRAGRGRLKLPFVAFTRTGFRARRSSPSGSR